jgi:hypothetical protein
MKKHMKHSDGKYHINGAIFEILIGSRAQVMHGTAYKTAGNLKKKDLKYNKHKKIVSRAKSAKGPQMLKRLHNKGYFTRKVNLALFAKMARVLIKADVRPGVLANARFILLREFVGKTVLMELVVSLRNLVIKDVKRVVNAHVVVDVVN